MDTPDLGPIVAECFKAIYTPLGGQTKKRDALSNAEMLLKTLAAHDLQPADATADAKLRSPATHGGSAQHDRRGPRGDREAVQRGEGRGEGEGRQVADVAEWEEGRLQPVRAVEVIVFMAN